jgi:hypothetical protein
MRVTPRGGCVATPLAKGGRGSGGGAQLATPIPQVGGCQLGSHPLFLFLFSFFSLIKKKLLSF